MKKCVAYCRVSTDSDEQMSSLENQIKHYTDLFKNQGYKGAECGMYHSKENGKEHIEHTPSIFADEGISGTKLKNREAFKYMLECAYRKEFDVIFVKNTARWARFVVDGSKVLKDLKVIGVKVIFEDGNINNFEHEMVINMFLSVAQEESRSKSEAVQFGIRKAQMNGKFTSGEPFGYDNNNGYLEINKDEAKIVIRVFNSYANGIGSSRIAKEFINECVKTKKGGRWTQSQIMNIIKNPIYIGKQITHTLINTDVNVDKIIHEDYVYKSKKKVDESEWIVHDKEELKIIPDDLYEKAQEQLAHNRKLIGDSFKPSSKHVLSNLLYCRHCGKSMIRKSKKGRLRKRDGIRPLTVEWVCGDYHSRYPDSCKFRNSWREEKILNRIKNEITHLLANKQLLDQKFNRYLHSFLTEGEVTEQIIKFKTKINDLKNESRAILKLYSTNKISEEQYEEENNIIQNERKEIESELKKLEKIENNKKQANQKYKNYLEFINAIDLNNLNNNLLKKIINKIEMFTIKDEQGNDVKDLYIVWNFMDKSFDDIYYKNALEK